MAEPSSQFKILQEILPEQNLEGLPPGAEDDISFTLSEAVKTWAAPITASLDIRMPLVHRWELTSGPLELPGVNWPLVIGGVDGRRTLKKEDFEYAVNTHEVRDHVKSPARPPTMTKKEQLLIHATITKGDFTHGSVLDLFEEFGIPLTAEEIEQAHRKLELTNLIDVEDGVYKYNTPLFISTLVGSEPETVARSLAEEIRERGENSIEPGKNRP